MKPFDESKLQRIKEFIFFYQRENGDSPSYRTIAKNNGLKDSAMIYRYIKILESREELQKTKSGKIAMPVQLETGRNIIAPLVGTVPCGEPQIVLEEIECSYALPADLFGNNDKFLLKAKGESMIEAGIHPSDLLVIERREEAENGEIVIALIDEFGESEATTKRYYKEKNGKIRLHPENSTLKDMFFDCEQVRICGVVVGVMRSYK